MNWKKTSKWLTAVAAALTLAACGGGDDTAEEKETEEETTQAAEEETTAEETEDESAGGEMSGEINVIARDAASGTRGAFNEITGVEDEEGNDNTQADAELSGTSEVITTVSGDEQAIGYISLGSLDDSVKAVNVGGVEATPENVASGDYELARPFNIGYLADSSDASQEFIKFIMSNQGQEVIQGEGYVESPDASGEDYEPTEGVSGEVTLSGSTSIGPVMEMLVEEFANHNTDVTPVIVGQDGSSAGMTDAMEGGADIGMASRELKDEESEALESLVIAMDGIAAIVHVDNPIEDLTLDQLRDIFTGEVTDWSEL